MSSDSDALDAAPAGGTPAAADAPTHAHAVYFDGRSSRKRRVKLELADGIKIVEQGGTLETWPYDAVRRAGGPADILRLRCVTALPLARLEISDAPLKEQVTAHCRALDSEGPTSRDVWRIVFWSLAAVASILAIAFFGVPLVADRLAPIIPAAIEKRIGEAVDVQARAMFGGRICGRREGQAAFNSLVGQIRRAGGVEGSLDAHVLSSKIPNAFALPGGKVYVLDGLLQQAHNADEVAGVIAHELGHIQHRDSLRRIIQTGGTSFLIGLLFGDITGGSAVIFIGRSLFDASYSRDAESNADTFAIDVMRRLGRSPKPLGEFLLRMTGAQAGKTLSIFSSHPLTEERLERTSRDAGPNTGPELLTPEQWRALKGICSGR
jgi:Zn-dependent protease with chaperone function